MRSAFLSAICAVSLAPQAQAEVCAGLGAVVEFGSGAQFDVCQVVDAVRRDLGLVTWPASNVALEIGGDGNSPFVRYWIGIGPLKPDAAAVSGSEREAITTALEKLVCLSSDLGGFVRAGGRVSMDMELLSASADPMAMHERTPLAAVTVANCEAL